MLACLSSWRLPPPAFHLSSEPEAWKSPGIRYGWSHRRSGGGSRSGRRLCDEAPAARACALPRTASSGRRLGQRGAGVRLGEKSARTAGVGEHWVGSGEGRTMSGEVARGRAKSHEVARDRARSGEVGHAQRCRSRSRKGGRGRGRSGMMRARPGEVCARSGEAARGGSDPGSELGQIGARSPTVTPEPKSEPRVARC